MIKFSEMIVNPSSIKQLEQKNNPNPCEAKALF
jgi:hypothetical protein